MLWTDGGILLSIDIALISSGEIDIPEKEIILSRFIAFPAQAKTAV